MHMYFVRTATLHRRRLRELFDARLKETVICISMRFEYRFMTGFKAVDLHETILVVMYSKCSSLLSVILVLLIINGCSDGGIEYHLETKLNPNKIAPLTALIHVEAEEPCSASILVLGKSPVEQSFKAFANSLEVPVVGLYPGVMNKVVLTLNFEAETIVDTVLIKTDSVPNYFPGVEINVADRSKMEPGMHLCDMHFANNGIFYSCPFIFDDDGVVRWYMDLGFYNDIAWPIQRMKNGNLLIASTNLLCEYDMLGRELSRLELSKNFRIHHDIVELPDGDLLLPIKKEDSYMNLNRKSVRSFNDFVLLYDKQSNKITKEWDLAKHMDVSRSNLNLMTPSDWIHINGIAFNEIDSSMIISGKNQGLVKLTWDDELLWIMGTKLNWGKAGRYKDGAETAPFVLTAVDADGKPYNDSIQNGYLSHADFDFPWGQHAPEVLPNGNILVFDNGYTRYYRQRATYSRAVEYNVNEENMTVEQVWQYGKERGPSFYSMLISDAEVLPLTKNVLVTFGFTLPHNARIVEVNYPEGKEVFEATLDFKTLRGTGKFDWGQLDILYRSERFELMY